MKRYEGLNPGLYLQVGGKVTALKHKDAWDYIGTFDDMLRYGTERSPSVETLAAEVGWVFVALRQRQQQIQEIPYTWERGGTELQDETPWDMPWREQMQQIDESLQLYATGYLFKQRAGGQLTGIRWLDPTTIDPDYETATPRDGIRRYWRKDDHDKRKPIPASDIIRFIVPGMRELRPGVAASRATSLAASILRGIDQAGDTFYENNALPVMLVKVPPGTGEQESNRLKEEFRRLFNRGRGTDEIRTKGVTGDVEVQTLSFKPADLAQSELEDHKIDLILAAHKVPKSIALANAANYATDVAASRRFVSAMGARLGYMAETLNKDRDFMAAGYRLVVRTESHFAMKEDEAQRAQAFKTFVDGGFEVEAAAYLVGITEDDFPEGFEVFKEPEPVPAALAPFAGHDNPPAQEPEEDGDAEAERERQAFRRWAKKRADGPLDVDDFESEHMTTAEKVDVATAIKQAKRKPTDVDKMVEAYTDRLARISLLATSGGIGRAEFQERMADEMRQTFEGAFRHELDLGENDPLPLAAQIEFDKILMENMNALHDLTIEVYGDDESTKGWLTDKLAAARDKLARRIHKWGNDLRRAANAAKTYAGGDFMWRLGATEKHCTDCLTNDGLVRSGEEWRLTGKLPQSRELECHGYNCDCSLVRV